MPSVLRVVRWPSFPFSPSSRYYWFYSIKYVPNDLLCLWFAWSSYRCRKGFWRQDVSFKLNILLQCRPILLRSLCRDVSGQDWNLCLTNLEFSLTCFFFLSCPPCSWPWPSHHSQLIWVIDLVIWVGGGVQHPSASCFHSSNSLRQTSAFS